MNIDTLRKHFIKTITDFCAEHHISVVQTTWEPQNVDYPTHFLRRARLILGFGDLVVVDIAQVSPYDKRPFFNTWVGRYNHFNTRETWPLALDSLRAWEIGNGFIHWSIRDQTDLARMFNVIKMALNVHDPRREVDVVFGWIDHDCAEFTCSCGETLILSTDDDPYTCVCGRTYELTQDTTVWEVEK